MSFTRKLYVSDTHFGHANIARLCNRPFSSVGEMDDYMVRRWNEAVAPSDLVYHLGDFACRADPERVRAVFGRLNGRKRLIIGNNDTDKKGRVQSWLLDLGWDEAPTHMVETKDGGDLVVLCHYPMRSWNGSGRGSWHFYGHCHGSLPGVGRSRDLGVDVPDVAFTPRTFHELTAPIRAAEQKEAAR
ncbi:MAG: hypothetical protein MEQ84_07600 [Mesorhizobium sp.]|nr:hypothetical protein [Mesorhizobium sp.]